MTNIETIATAGALCEMSLFATYLGANGWLLEFDRLRVLVDPWLQGSLSFPPGEWLLKGDLPQSRSVPEGLDLLLLTQGLADHAHPPTLELLPRDLPVIGSQAAIGVVNKMGFERATVLRPGQRCVHQGLNIRATAGAPVPYVENGYVLEHAAGRLYLEPHGFLDPSLEPQPLDVVITPMVDLGLPLLGPFVRGCSVVPKLVDKFQPTTVVASTAGGDVRFTGALSQLLQLQGSPQRTGDALPDAVQWIDPVPAQRFELPCFAGKP